MAFIILPFVKSLTATASFFTDIFCRKKKERNKPNKQLIRIKIPSSEFLPKSPCPTWPSCHYSACATPESTGGKVNQALMEEKPAACGAKAGKDLQCWAQQSQRCSPPTAGHQAAWGALLGLGDLNPAFITGLDTATTVGQLVFKQEERGSTALL